MKIEVGTKLTVRSDLNENMDIRFGVNKEMEALAGKTVEVTEVYENIIKINLDDGAWSWSLNMFSEFATWIKSVLDKHKKWVQNEEGGERADLRGADLRDADLYGADLCGADLCDANLRGANGEGIKIKKVMFVGPIGSRDDTTQIFFATENKILVKCGCFYNYINEFEKAVHKEHEGTEYEKQYMAMIELAKAMSVEE